MAKQLEIQGRQFWIMSDPEGQGWKAFVVEVKGGVNEEIGIEATAETRGLADDACERKLVRLMKA